MKRLRLRLLSSSVIKLGVGGGIAAGSALALAACSNPYAAPGGGSAETPTTMAQANPCAAANPCNPCAAKSPCAAAASRCSPCNPCAAAAAGPTSECEVPRLVQQAAANPCAAKNPCSPCAAASPCNPCAAKSPCNPCAAKNPCAASNPCNPCAAAANPCNPCNPCAPAEAVELTAAEAEAAYECIKDTMQDAYTGGLQQAAASPCNPCAAANPCNPCAAKNPCAANPCNPCAPVKPASPCNPCAATNPCNPCAAKNPCNPCASASPCNPCAANPCGPQAAAAVPDDVATVAEEYQGWTRVNTAPYVSATHGSRYVNNYPGPEAADAYRQYEDIDGMPVDGRIAKDSFTVSPDGQVGVGPLFIMEKMQDGFNAASDDWRYAMIMPDGSLFGVTGGQGSANVEFCAGCHAIVADDQDSLYFLPEEFRVTSR